MTWSYNIASGAAKDQVRLVIGDTNAADPQLQDEELALFVAQYPDDIYMAGHSACLALQARYSRQVSKTLGQMSITASDRARAYQTLAETLKQQSAGVFGTDPMVVGGQTLSQHQRLYSNPSLVQGTFRRGQYDEPATSDRDGWPSRGTWNNGGRGPC